jgi:hypothetical protein
MSQKKAIGPEVGQRERFEQTARELGMEYLDEEKLREALRQIAPDKSAGHGDDDQSSDKSSKASS